jgi:hypothetical protein
MDCFVASAFARRRASADRSAPLRKRFAFVAGNDDKTRLRNLAARCARGLPEISLPSNQRAQGMPGARCARSRAWCVESTRVSHHGHTGKPRIDIDPGFGAWKQGIAGPAGDAGGSISRRRFARGVVIPGLCGKCAHARSRGAGTPCSVRRTVRSAGIGVFGADIVALRNLPRARMVLPGHRRRCQHRCSNQPSRQKFGFGHSVSPQGSRSQRCLASLPEMRATADKLNATFPHGFSPPREIAKATDITAESFRVLSQ